MKKPIEFSYCFTDEDVSAIIAALPLVSIFGADTEIQQQINETLCTSAIYKLTTGDTNLIPNEFRVISLSVGLAKEFLAGRLDFDLDVSTEILSEIHPHIFTYNRLDATFRPVVEEFLKRMNR